ncbi:unnamed protein product, partial [Mesorhabditis belari]|uniref:Saposin B-type domain-containing protein n=1 Tax=Mesorhabditis belari TaxID=2138241 RepID=A0AAF3FM33_9BILA
MKLLIVLGVVIGTTLCLPFDVVSSVVARDQSGASNDEILKPVQPEKKDDQCGEITSPLLQMRLQIRSKIRKIRASQMKPEQANTVQCQLCLDLVDIAKTYEECDEAKVEHKMESECDKDFKADSAGDKACRGLVDGIMEDMIDKTEDQSAPAICSKRLGHDCKY